MDYDKYQKLLSEKIEESFAQWDTKKTVSESQVER